MTPRVTGTCTYQFIQGKRKGTACGANTRDRTVTLCHEHKPRKNAKPPRITGTCIYQFVQGRKKGTVCGTPTARQFNNICYRHKNDAKKGKNMLTV